MFICRRCETPVVFTDVSEGYFAVCPEHEEDLYMFETCYYEAIKVGA